MLSNSWGIEMEIMYKTLSWVEPSERLTRLFCELTGAEISPDVNRLNSLIAAGALAFHTAWLDGKLVGMASVIPCSTTLSNKLWIEDVAVLSEFHGFGIGRGLLEFAMADSRSRFFDGTFWLTSRPSRIAARKMYASMGFKEYETGVFYLDILS